MTDWAYEIGQRIANYIGPTYTDEAQFLIEEVAAALRKAKADGIRFAIDHVDDDHFWLTDEDRMAHFAPEHFVNWLHNQASQIEKGQ